MARKYSELLPTSMFQSLATEFAHQAMTSDYLDPCDLMNLKSNMIKSICGKSIKINLANEEQEEFDRLTEHFNNKLTKESHTDLQHNCRVLANGLELPINAWKVIRLMVVMTTNGGLNQFIEYMSPSDMYINALFGSMVGLNETEVININSALSETGLFQDSLINLLDLAALPRGIVDGLIGEKVESYTALIAPLVQIQPKSELTFKDMAHLDLSTLVEFLTVAVNHSLVGVSLLIHGDSGSGKTQLSRLLADTIGASLIAIKPLGEDINQSHHDYGNSIDGSALRLQHLRLIQNVIAPDEKTLFSIEEAEDILSLSSKSSQKNSLTDVLETNIAPCIFLTNHVEVIDPAILRRFTYIIQVNIPSQVVMSRIINKTTKGLRLSKEFKVSLANRKHVAPAHITNAAFVCKTLNQVGNRAQATMQDMIDEVLLACGFDEHKSVYKPQMPFCTEFLNIRGGNQAIDQIAKAVNKNSDIRVLLTGPPGTGKTAAVNYFAKQANKELITVRCSDILDKWVGSAEKNIAQKFLEAEEKSAILFFDEIDGLLRSRDMAQNSWEVTQTLELLTQIESFNFPFFCATNFVEKLDSAMNRRIDIRLQFQYLASPQVLKLYNRLLGGSDIPHDIKTELEKLTLLAAGDFAVLTRRERIATKRLSHEERLHILKAENDRKQQSKSIGFIQ